MPTAENPAISKFMQRKAPPSVVDNVRPKPTNKEADTNINYPKDIQGTILLCALARAPPLLLPRALDCKPLCALTKRISLRPPQEKHADENGREDAD